MTKGIEELKRDLDIISAMSQEMDPYLESDVLFWPLTQAAYPKLTLGGYLMRLKRLQMLTSLLNEEERLQLTTIDDHVQTISRERIVQVEEKAGAFIWPEEWQPAYPENQYWWLYGLPRFEINS